ncbi:MAG: hypothetical protein ACKOFE_04275, partial [Bacteroidota bacterium]
MRTVLLYLWSKASFMPWSPGWGQRWGLGLGVAMVMVLVMALTMALTSVAEAQWLPAFGRSRIGTAGFQFLKIQPDARSAAMAG